jgi:hypothetical protein
MPFRHADASVDVIGIDCGNGIVDTKRTRGYLPVQAELRTTKVQFSACKFILTT